MTHAPFGHMTHAEPTTIEEDTELYERVVSQMRERMGVDTKRPGDHVSDLIYCLRKAWVKKHVVGDDVKELLGDTPDETAFVWIIGHSHEAIFGQGSIRGKSQTKDGIWYTPDFFAEPATVRELMEATWPTDVTDEAAAEVFRTMPNEAFYEIGKLTEMKSTRASANKRLDEGEMQHYIDQVAAYAAAEGREEVWIWVFYIMGNYYHQTKEGKASGAGPKAMLRLWKLTFDERTRRLWWETLIHNKEIVNGMKMPPAAPKYDWECGYCQVRELIQCEGGEEWQRAQARKGAREQSLDQPATE